MAKSDKKAKAWQRRWELERQRQIEVLRGMTPGEKLTLIGQLYATLHPFVDQEQREREVAEVRAKWMKIHKAYEKQMEREQQTSRNRKGK